MVAGSVQCRASKTTSNWIEWVMKGSPFLSSRASLEQEDADMPVVASITSVESVLS